MSKRRKYTRFWTKKVAKKYQEMLLLHCQSKLTADQEVEFDKLQRLRQRELNPMGKDYRGFHQKQMAITKQMGKLADRMNKLIETYNKNES